MSEDDLMRQAVQAAMARKTAWIEGCLEKLVAEGWRVHTLEHRPDERRLYVVASQGGLFGKTRHFWFKDPGATH